ncbi:hypothetical protein SLEP1_g3665 [Rubroshorea leprosula]|uniref:Aminotransferase-like plant mobile domain-containing protein n=1 Tax=Rubroshorea leprosula TaxID=152421 RepID=A0AAV5HUC9_9ROSI|nr:hypothetical protein SLEP1_g3665 [Rubroshorea leprosula]
MAGSKKTGIASGAVGASSPQTDPPEQMDPVDIFENQDLQEELSSVCNQVPKDFLDQIFLETSDSLILGPVFTSTPPSNLHALYPQPHRHFLPFQLEPDWEPWLGRFGSWPTNKSDDWSAWVARLEKPFGNTWKTLGLYEFIQMTTYQTSMDRVLLGTALLFWSGSYNCFHFPCGAMSVTLLDICSLTGLPCVGEEIMALLSVSGADFDTKSILPSYNAFIKASQQPSEAPDVREHTAFLLTLICKFIVCVAGKGPTKEYITLALALAHGRHLALAPFLLASLYRSCYDATVYPFSLCGGPLWLLQLWLYCYFPTLAPILKPLPIEKILTYGMIYKDATFEDKPVRTYETCFQFFASLSIDKPDSEFAPFLSRQFGPDWYKAEIGTTDFISAWTTYVTPRDLFIGCSNNCKKSGAELYALNQFSRQLGYCQGIPVPPMFSFNHCFPLRDTMKGPSVVSKCLATSMLALQNINLQDPPFKPKCTTAYKEWWKSYFTPSFFGVAKNFINLLPSSHSSQPAVNIEPQTDDTIPDSAASRRILAKRRAIAKWKASSMASPETDKASHQAPKRGGIKRAAQKPPSVKRLATMSPSSPSEASSAVDVRLQGLIDEITHNPTIKDPIDKSPSREDSDSSPSNTQKLSSKTRSSRSSLRLANKNFKTVNPNEVIDLSLTTKKTTTSTTSTPFQASFPTPTISTSPTTIDDAMEDEIFAKFEKLTSPPLSRELRLTRKGKLVIENTGSDTPIPSPEQISIAIQTLGELINGDPANFYRLPDQPTIISAAKILSHSPDLSQTLERLTDSADQAEEELTLMRMEWSDWRNHFP